MTKKSNDLKEGGKKMKSSKGICLLAIALIVLLAFPVQGSADTSEWVSADDGAAEVRFISWEAGTYPEYKLKLQFRLDQSQESNIWSFTFDIKNESTANNRRVKAACSGKIEAFTCVSETTYKVRLPYTMGEKEKYIAATIDLAEVFPDDFINLDAYYAAECIKGLENMLNDPTDYEFSDFQMFSSEIYSNTVYFVFTLTAKNKMGGKTSEQIFANYNTADGTVYVLFSNALKFKVYGGNNYVPYPQMLSELQNLVENSKTITATSIKNYLK